MSENKITDCTNCGSDAYLNADGTPENTSTFHDLSDLGIHALCDGCNKLEDQACNNDEVKCPYCGYEYSESYEFLNGARDDFSDFNVSCDYCHQEFNVQPEKSISYSSIKIKAKK